MFEILQYSFAQNAFLAGILASVVCALIGTFVVVNRMVSISGALAHISFGGIGLGYFLGIDPLTAAIPFSVSSSLLIGLIQEKIRQNSDVLIGILWAVGMALGVLFIHFSPGYAPDLMSYIFGNILTVSTEQIILLSALVILITVSIAVFYQKLKTISFDEQFARASGINVFAYRLILLALVSLSIIVLIKLVGIILVIALLSIPAEISRRASSSLFGTIKLSIIISLFLTLGGLTLSFWFDTPSGATIVILMGAAYFLSLLIPQKS